MDFGKDVFDLIMELISLYDFGRSACNKLMEKSQFEKNRSARTDISVQLQEKLHTFMRNHEESLFLDSDWFFNFLKYQHPIEKIIEYTIGENRKTLTYSQNCFIDGLVCDAQRAAEGRGGIFRLEDKSVLKKLFRLLIDSLKSILDGQMDLPQMYGKNEIIRNIWQSHELQNTQFETMLAARKRRFAEKSYEYPKPHIKRFCYNQENRLTGKSEFVNRFQLTKLCQRHPFIVLLGEAGNGKSTELQWTAAYYSEHPNLPRPVYLTLKTYMDETIENLAKKQGFFIEEEQELFFLIDGFDEISGGNKQNFLKQLTVYHEQNPKARFLVSARNNFYRKDLLGDFFETVWIEPLRYEDAIAFIRESGIEDEEFITEIKKHNLKELLLIPFYLIELCKIYKAKKTLPKQNQLMEELIEQKFAEDSKKFRMTMDVDFLEQRSKVFSQLQKIAVAMHGMDCHFLQESDYEKLLPSPKERELLRFSSIWKSQEGGWLFSHNNFSEYLAAEYLGQCSLDDVKKLVCAGYPELGICRNWNHVLSYLLSMENKDMEEWLLEEDFTLFFDSDKNRIPIAKRSKILRKEWERLKSQHEWITSQRYRPEKLMQFGMNYPEVQMFLEEIKNPSDIIVQQNAILALGYCPNLFGCGGKVRDTLMEVCQKPQEHGCVYERAILCILKLGLMGESEFETLMKIFWDTDSSEVRYALYCSIRFLGEADRYIRFLTNGLKYVCLRKGRLGNEAFELHYTMMEIEDPSASIEVIKELTENDSYYYIFEIDKVIDHIFTKFKENEVRFAGDNWELLAKFYEKVTSLGRHNLETLVLTYFSSVGEKIRLFEYELKKVAEGKASWIFLRPLVDDTSSKWAMEQYKDGKLDQAQVKWCLDVMDEENAAFNELKALYFEISGFQIPDRIKIDYAALRSKGEADYQKGITRKESYLSLVDELIRLYGKKELKEKDLEESCLEWKQNRYDLEEIKMDFLRSGDRQTVQQWRESIKKEWEEFEGFLLLNWLYGHNCEKEDIPKEIEAAARAYFDRNIGTIDFFQAVKWQTDETYQIIDWRGQKLLDFAWLFDFPMEKSKAEGILVSTYFLGEKQTRSLLERYFDKEELRKLILNNMMEGELKGIDMELHLGYCKEMEIRECADKIYNIAVDHTRPEWVRERAVDYFYNIIGAEAVCQEILPKLDGRLFLDAVSQIVEEEPEGLADILWEYSQKSEKDKVFCYKYLIQLKDNRGLKAYGKLLEQSRKVEMNPAEDGLLRNIGSIRNEELWEELFNLVELWCQPDFEDAEFEGLGQELRRALSGIAGNSDKGYQAVMAVLEEKGSKEAVTFFKKVQLEHWKGEARENYKQSVQRKWSVDEMERWLARDAAVPFPSVT